VPLELARAHEFTIFEDDPYVSLRFEGESLPTMLSMGDDVVVYASSFSKTVCPGIRVGYLVGPADLIARIVKIGDQHVHLSKHGVAGDRQPVLPLGSDRPLDRDRSLRLA
jgi:aspartate/methionine/tyrosine aminotransferase